MKNTVFREIDPRFGDFENSGRKATLNQGTNVPKTTKTPEITKSVPERHLLL